jgi:hypothetical protein
MKRWYAKLPDWRMALVWLVLTFLAWLIYFFPAAPLLNAFAELKGNIQPVGMPTLAPSLRRALMRMEREAKLAGISAGSNLVREHVASAGG